ncbi:MAG: YXWGXW repeat-containing protein [Caldimonas sp.]
MFVKIASATVLVAAAAGFAAPAVAAPHSIDIRVGPPAPRFEAVPAPRRGYVWAPGYWDRRGHRYGWVGGNWVRERPGYVYAQPTWVNQGGRYHFYRGAWARGGGDRDHDGVPNRYDRRPNNPHRR